MTGPFTSQIPLLIGVEVLTIVAFVLSILTLTAGPSTNLLRHSAILTVQWFQVTWYTRAHPLNSSIPPPLTALSPIPPLPLLASQTGMRWTTSISVLECGIRLVLATSKAHVPVYIRKLAILSRWPRHCQATQHNSCRWTHHTAHLTPKPH